VTYSMPPRRSVRRQHEGEAAAASVVSASTEFKDVLAARALHEHAKGHRKGFAFRSDEAFVVEYGRPYDSAPLTARERAYVQCLIDGHRHWWTRSFRYNHCFANSQELLAFDTTGRVVYVEGYVWAYGDRLPPVHHAWLALHGKVIDVTVVTRAMARLEQLPEGPKRVLGHVGSRAYFGVPFLRSHFAFRRSLNRGHGSLIDDEVAGYPLLRFGGDGVVRRHT
jgi:hypothetical protein